MTTLDFIVLSIFGISILLGVMRGFIREAFSLGAWVLAFVTAQGGARWLAPLLPDLIAPPLRYATALATLFLLTWLLSSLLGSLVRSLVAAVGMGGVDRLLGASFGLLRGLILLTMFTLILGLSAMPKTELWQASYSRSLLENNVRLLIPWLPDDLVNLLQFSFRASEASDMTSMTGVPAVK